ncbi:MAG TPA: leucyl aminopeptidase [Jatrophihabitantaceae bacterium]|jgi:leucyl aminopeptidase|nr:leucyl aminopeptidase [Jatrophihabitantaceae bacterium]
MPSAKLVPAASPPGTAAVVIGAVKPGGGAGGPVLAAGSEPVDAALGGRLTAALIAAGATGAADEVTKIPTLGLAGFPLVVVAGLGGLEGGELAPEQVRRGVGAALRAITGAARVRIALGGDDLTGAVAEGALLGAYRFSAYKSAPPAAALKNIDIAVPNPRNAAALRMLKRAVVVAEAVAFTRDLVNTPPNDLYPDSFAARARTAAEAVGLEVEVLDERGLRKGGFGGIVGVGAGSVRPPRLVRVTYRPPRSRARIALVGKGITFDSGGLNIKTANMAWMKSDMGGAAAVIAAVIAAARLKLPVEIIATVPMAENLPSGTAYRPSDVLTLRGGTTVEVGDTDAEGRLVLADAITRAVEDAPDYLIEASTLTGGQLVALGPRVIGAMGEPTFRDSVAAVGNSAGEAIWSMPLPAELRRGLDSTVADLVNVSTDRWGSMLVGGLFLADFVPAGLPWVHLDIAGPAWNLAAGHGYTPKGGTGAAVRTIIATAESLAGTA